MRASQAFRLIGGDLVASVCTAAEIAFACQLSSFRLAGRGLRRRGKSLNLPFRSIGVIPCHENYLGPRFTGVETVSRNAMRMVLEGLGCQTWGLSCVWGSVPTRLEGHAVTRPGPSSTGASSFWRPFVCIRLFGLRRRRWCLRGCRGGVAMWSRGSIARLSHRRRGRT